ncbi:nucleotide-sugar transmembrane transporter [Aureococcus anophagefferens]|uniref:Nucleotide-sugar transmembrane transporter n=1 Tax=Aureococcus anophagefferens TaxID=44056 RepID=A0ABR1G1M4_AURAN
MPGSDVVVLFLSCVIATLIGYAGWLCRGLVSAAPYTLIGVANKRRHGPPRRHLPRQARVALGRRRARLLHPRVEPVQAVPLRADVAKAQTPKSPGSAPSENPKSGG